MEITVKIDEELASWALREAARRSITTGEALRELIEAARGILEDDAEPSWQ